MPEYGNVPEVEQVSLDSEPLKFSFEEISEQYALTKVIRDFEYYERERQSSERRWRLNDALYCAYVEPRYWPNTKLMRSNLGAGIVSEQIEAAYAMLCQALFTQPEYFSIEADVGGDPKAARQQGAYMDYAFNYPQVTQMSAEVEYKNAAKDQLLYGAGILKVEFNSQMKIPFLTRKDPRNIYFDPAVSGPFIDRSRAVIERTFLTIEELERFRSDSRMKVPSKDVLWTLSQGITKTAGDRGKEYKEALHGVQYSIGASDNSPIPSQKRIELLQYYTANEIIWILNRKVVMYKDTNIYGFLPYVLIPCYVYTSSPYSLSIADMQESNHRYLESLVNARLDQVTLTLFPPRAVPRGFMFTPQMQSWGPGSMYQMDEPEKFNQVSPPDVTKDIFQEIGYIQASADRKTGINSMLSGQPSPSNANRTASGVNSQLQGSAIRLYPIVDNFENYGIIPSVWKALKMAEIHLSSDDVVPGVERDENNPEDAKFIQVSAQAFRTATRVRARAASKMLSRDRLTQMYQFVAQNVMNGQVIGMLNQSGQTVDFSELIQMLMDATGVPRRYAIVRPLTPEEKQFMQQQQQAQEQAKQPVEMMKAQLESQTRLQMGQMKVQGEQEKNKTALQIAQMKNSGPSPEEIQMEQMKAQMEMALKNKDMELKEHDLRVKQATSQLQMIMEQAKLKGKQQEIAMKSQENQMGMMAKRSEMGLNLQTKAAMNQQSLRHSEEAHQQQMKLKQSEPKVNSVRVKRSAVQTDKKRGDKK